MEYNACNVARPLVAFDTSNIGTLKTVPKADQSLLNAGEMNRAMFDVQGAGAWHKGWTGLKVGDSNSVMITREGGRLQTSNPDELERMQKIAKEFGFPHVADNGQGFTFTDFEKDYDKLPEIDHKKLKKLVEAVGDELPNPTVERSKIDAGYLGFEDEWKRPQGSGAVVNKYLEEMDKMPSGTYDAINNNPYIPQVVLNKLERDENYRDQFGLVREDVQNLRRIAGEGPGFIDRLKKAVKAGTIPLPAVVALVTAMQTEEETVQ